MSHCFKKFITILYIFDENLCMGSNNSNILFIWNRFHDLFCYIILNVWSKKKLIINYKFHDSCSSINLICDWFIVFIQINNYFVTKKWIQKCKCPLSFQFKLNNENLAKKEVKRNLKKINKKTVNIKRK